jgi:ribosome-binding protein aMBF1 (putative translation factor)
LHYWYLIAHPMTNPARMRKRRKAVERLRERLGHVDDHSWFSAKIADEVATQRQARGLSQKELAELCGTTQPAIARLEAGGQPPRLRTLLRIADALDCELEVRLRPRTKPREGT